MADITEGMTIQAVWFTNIDTTGNFKKNISFLNDSDPINLGVNSVNLAQITTDGDLKTRGSMTDYDTDI